MLEKAKIIKNYKLKCLDGEIGKVKDFYFDDETWTIKYLVINTGNWLIGRKVLISPQSIKSMSKDDESFVINLTKSQIENSPILESDKFVSKDYLKKFHIYYEFPIYSKGAWYGEDWKSPPHMPSDAERKKFIQNIEDESEWDPHLRSMKTVSGYYIQATDGEIGHLDDFIFDAETWKINYLEIDTKNWLPGRRFIISPEWIDHVGWDDSTVFVNHSTDEIEHSPEYTSETVLDLDFEKKLHDHYNREGN